MSKSLTAAAITGGNLFIDGIGYLGDLVSATMPKFEQETLEASSSIGKYELVLPTLKPITASFVVNNPNQIYFNLLKQQTKSNIYIKKNLSQMDGINIGVVATFEGYIKSLELPNMEMNKEAQLSFEMNCILIKYEVDKKTNLLYDVENGFYTINGSDQYETIRKNIF